jgi:beta-lactamase regulating signal transducer with metallopeptidase domain/protocatechuate 3,4-dioxygenase beta subunit
MITLIDPFALWLVDFYLLATVSLLIALAVCWRLKQPVQRLAAVKSTLIALFLLAALCALPGWSLIHLIGHDESRANATPQLAASAETTSIEIKTLTIPPNVPADTRTTTIAGQSITAGTNLRSSSRWPAVSLPAAISITHLSGAACGLAWLALGAFAAHQLRRSSLPVSAELQALMREVSNRQNNVKHSTDLRSTSYIDVAVALGVFRPVVLLPTDWLETQSREELRTILAHEAAHIAGGDLRWLAASRVLSLLLWAHPLYWLLRRRMRLDQEALADAAAADLTSRQRYAEQLVTWARQLPARPAARLTAAVGLWERPSQLRQRIKLLLDERLAVLRCCSRIWRLASLTICTLSAVALSLVTLQPTKSQENESRQRKGLEPRTKIAAPDEDMESGTNAETNISYTITGQLVEADGKGIEEASVYLPLFRSWLPNQLETAVHATSDADGNYRLTFAVPPDWPAGPYERGPIVWAFTPKRNLAIAPLDVQKLRQEKSVVLNLILRPQQGVSFGVVGPDGNPIAGAEIRPWHVRYNQQWAIPPLSVQKWLSTTTDERGNATLHGIEVENYGSIRAETESFGIQHMWVGDDRPSVLRLSPVGRLEGRVIADEPAAVRERTVVVESSPQNYQGFAVVVTDDNGRFVIPKLAAGEGRIRCEFDPELPFRPRDARQPVLIRANETTSIEIFLDRMHSNDTDSLLNIEAETKPVEIPIIVAKHVLLHEGKIIEWADVERLITALPNPKLAQPGFYFTHRVAADRQDEIRAKIWDLRRGAELRGHSWGSISPRTSFRYDAIRSAADLMPNESWRVNGTVETADGLPIDGAEVVLLMPVDESLSYKSLDIYLRDGRLREPYDEVVTHSDTGGRFTIYPPPNTPYYLVALHREGFGLARSTEFAKSKRIAIQSWARIRGKVKEDTRFKQSASISEHVPADGAWPKISFQQYSVDLGPISPSGEFEFAFVPPLLQGTLSRSVEGEQGTSFGLPARKFKLSPGETLSIDIEPPTGEEAARVAMLKAEDERRHREALAARAAEDARKVDPNELAGRVVDADGKPLSGVVVDVWTWHPGNETLTDADGRFSLGGFDDREVVEVQFTKPGYGPALFVDRQTGLADWTVTLASDTFLEGRVLGPDGKPVPRARIRAVRGPFENPEGIIGAVWTETGAAADGRYRMHFEPGKYDIHVRAPRVGLARLQNTMVAKGDQRQLDIQLRLGPTFRAQVLDSQTNEPVAGIRLSNWQQPGIEGVSAADGMLTIENMTPGEFEFQVSAVGEKQHELAGQYARWWSPDAIHTHQRKAENDTSGIQRNFDDLAFNVLGNTEPVKIFVEKAVSIRGRVIDPDGNPVAGATVAPAKTGSGNSITGDTRYSVKTADDGTFHLRLPASGTSMYNLIAHDGGYQEWRRWANGVGDVLHTRPAEELTGIELELTRPGIVRGKVLDGDGKPVPKHRVRTQAADKLENRYYDPVTRTDEKGEFEFRFVRPGEHYVQADPFWLAAEDADSDTSKRISVKAGETVDGIELIHRPSEPVQFLPSALPGDDKDASTDGQI